MPKAAVATASPFSRNDRVFAAEDLPRVPAGTEGKVIMVQGLSWIRYWVWFDNGERVGTIHRNKLMNADEWARRNDAPASTAVAGASASSATGAADTGAADTGAAAMADVGGVPGHLLERSRLARERLGKPKG